MATPFPFTSGQTLTAAQMNTVTTLPVSTKTASYTCVVGDVGSRIVMNVATANTVTINNSIFAEGDTIFIANKGAGVSTITAGAGVTINTTGSLALAQHGGGTLVALSASVFAFFSGSAGVSYGVATGGSSSSITVSSQAYTLLSFTSDSSLVVSTTGLFDVYMVGAGGGGGGGKPPTSSGGGGGGAGGLVQSTIYLTAATYAVDIGAGGAGGTGITTLAARNGFGSCIGTGTNFIVADGGGGGGNPAVGVIAGVGGNGGGGGGEVAMAGAPASTPIGFAGGSTGVGANGASGGGGQTAVGANSSSSTGAAGGAGASPSTFTGGTFTTTIGVGGTGGNATGSTDGTAGGANTGSGGNGGNGGATQSGGAGGSGRIFVRFKV